jgi:hypothetical protein
MRTAALERMVHRAEVRRDEAADHCGLCSEAVPQSHRHLLDTGERGVMCVCRPCALLFRQDAASMGHYRLIPERRVRLAPVPTKALGVPVGLAFFVPRDETVVAHYPSPLGATEWEVDPSAWQDVVAGYPLLADLAADVEALLVNTAHNSHDHWIVPVDDCFRLVAVVRREWRGMSGGDTVWPQIERFFDNLTEQR